MTRGKGVRLQKYKDGGLSDIKTFSALSGLVWSDSSGRSFVRPLTELAEWQGERASAGRTVPAGFPRNNRFVG
jgi:topoisomerase-4 subunit A